MIDIRKVLSNADNASGEQLKEIEDFLKRMNEKEWLENTNRDLPIHLTDFLSVHLAIHSCYGPCGYNKLELIKNLRSYFEDRGLERPSLLATKLAVEDFYIKETSPPRNNFNVLLTNDEGDFLRLVGPSTLVRCLNHIESAYGTNVATHMSKNPTYYFESNLVLSLVESEEL